MAPRQFDAYSLEYGYEHERAVNSVSLLLDLPGPWDFSALFDLTPPNEPFPRSSLACSDRNSTLDVVGVRLTPFRFSNPDPDHKPSLE